MRTDMQKKKSRVHSKLFFGAAVFLVCALIVQSICLVAATEQGQMMLFPLNMRLNSSKISKSELSVSEFYPIHDEIDSAKLIVLSIDEGVADSYTLAERYLEFLRRFTDLDYVVTYASNSRLTAINEASVSGDGQAFSEAIENCRKYRSFSEEYLSFVSECYDANSKLLPDNKFSLFGIRSIESFADVRSRLTEELLFVPNGFDSELQKLTAEQDSATFCSRFKELSSKLSDVLKDKYETYSHEVELLENGCLAEMSAFEKMESLVPTGEGVIFALLPESICYSGSPFLEAAEQYYGKTVVHRVRYYDCQSKNLRDTTQRNDGFMSFLFDGIRIVPMSKSSAFRNRLAAICNASSSSAEIDSLIGDVGRSSVFTIGGSSGVSYAWESETADTDTSEDTTNADT